jgi:hypothetical protein
MLYRENLAMSGIQTHIDCIGSLKSHYHTIATTMAPTLNKQDIMSIISEGGILTTFNKLLIMSKDGILTTLNKQ